MWGCLPLHLGHLEGTCNPIDCVLIDSSPGFKMFEVNGLEALNVLCCANRINYESLGPKYHGSYLGQPFFFSKTKANEDKLESQMCPGSPGCPQWVAFTVPNLHKVAGFPWCEACHWKAMAGQLVLSNCISSCGYPLTVRFVSGVGNVMFHPTKPNASSKYVFS